MDTKHKRTPSRLLWPLATLLGTVALTACGVATAGPTPTSPPPTIGATATAAAPAATPTPDLTSLLQDGGIAIVETAFHRLMDTYIDPLDSSRLLDGAWTLLAQEADAQGLDLPAKPAFDDNRPSDISLFRVAYVQLAAQSSDPAELRYAAVRGMTQTLQDCHTFFLGPVASESLGDAQAGRGTVGVGFELAGVPPLVTEVITGGPAQTAGILVGDRIVSVDGIDTSGFGPSNVFDLVNGDDGTSVRLGVRRGSDGRTDIVSATRARVVPPNIESRVIDGTIGYVRIRQFVDAGIASALRDELAEFESQGVASWILDVRGNPGGRLDPDAFSLFVKDGVIIRDRGRDGLLEEQRASGNSLPVVRPTVVLTNNRTGSVAEIFASALQEHGVAHIIGDTTNGCAGFTDIRPFGDGSSMAVTTYVSQGPVSGKELAGYGVTPDQAVARTPDDIANARDPQIDAAVAYLAGPQS